MKAPSKIIRVVATVLFTIVVISADDAFSIPVDGDFNGDGNVTATDFLQIQFFGNSSDLSDWEDNYGTSSALTAACSEPCGIFGNFPSPSSSVAVDVSLNVIPDVPADPTQGGIWTLVAKSDSPIGIAAIAAVLVNVAHDDTIVSGDIGAIDPIANGRLPFLNVGGFTELIYGQDIFGSEQDVMLGVGLLASSGGLDPLGDPLWDDATKIASGTYSSLVPSILEVGTTVFSNAAAPFAVDIATSSSRVRILELPPDPTAIFVDPDNLGATDVVEDPAGTLTLISNPVADPLNVGQLAVGNTGNGTLLVSSGGTINSSAGLEVGASGGSAGILTVTGAATLVNVVGSSDIGATGIGKLNVADGAQVDIGGDLRLAANGAGNGNLDVASGELNLGGDLEVGVSGVGLFTQTEGVVDVTGKVFVGNNSGSRGRYDMQGGTSTAATGLAVGNSGVGELTVSGSSQLNISGAFTIATQVGSNGSRVIVSGGTINANDGVYVGGSDTAAGDSGTLAIVGGELFVGSTLKIWPTGVLEIEGGTVTTAALELAGGLDFDGGTLNITGTGAHVGTGGGSGTQFGTLLNLSPTANLNVSGGTVDVAADGLVSINANSSLLAAGGTNDGTIQANSAVLTFTAAATNNGTISAIDATIDAQAGLTNNGKLNLINTTVTGALSNVAGVTSSGTVTLDAAVTGSGDFTGDGEVVFSGSFAPGDSPGIVDFAADVTFDPTNTLLIELSGTDNSDPLNPDFDALLVAGAASLDGALDVSLLGGYVPTAGDSFEIISASELTGIFSSETLPTLSGQLGWDVDYDFISDLVTLSVVTPFTADFDGDGDVDDIDLNEPVDGWQARFGTDLGGGDFLAWQRQLGSGLNGAAASAPEPSALLLAMIAGLAYCSCKGNHR